MAGIRKVAVLGAGVMGSGIAAHVAGAGVRVLLLDIVPPDLPPEKKADRTARNRFADGGKQKALTARPAAFFTSRDAALVETGNLEDDLDRLAECDWIIEAVKEDLAVKQALYARVERVRRPGSVVSSNTSGLPLARLVEGRGDDFKRSFLITHFFNPVRYMKLLELVLGPQTDPSVAERMHRFGEDVLGKGIVWAKDTPNFVANRIGTYAVMDAIRLMVEHDLTIEAVDVILGQPVGHPKSAVFRTADIVGLDTLIHVADNCRELLVRDEERETFAPPDFMREMVRRGMLGDKSGGGFYRKTPEGILALDWKTLEYRPQQKPRFESVGAARTVEDVGERMRTLIAGEDAAAHFAWRSLARSLNYSAWRLGEIADDVVNIDRALRWGFNWDLGPFETLDALGLRDTVARMERDGMKIAPVLREAGPGEQRFYPTRRTYRDPRQHLEKPIPASARSLELPREDRARVVHENDSATLWDVGDEVLCLEFHSKMNSVDPDLIAMLHRAVDEAERGKVGLVIGNEAQQAFSAGANLFMILLAAREQQWTDLERLSAELQRANQRVRYASVPIVAAPFGLTLGGGAEIALAAPVIRAHAELYMGLVEVGVGVIPAAGGVKEMVARVSAALPPSVDPFVAAQRVFELIGTAQVSTSAERAREFGFLRDGDRVTLSREQLLHDAKQTVLGLSRAGYRAPTPPAIRVAGEAGFANFRVALWSMRQGHQLSDHDLKIGLGLARVICGGEVAPNTQVTEQHLLDLEREVFLSLCGEQKSQERMEHMLKTNKPLRN